MRLVGFVITLSAAASLFVGADPASAGLISFSYNFGAPNLGANQTIKQLDVGVTVLSSAVGKNVALANPALQTTLKPNPFIMPPPNCVARPDLCVQVPVTTDGVDPKTKMNPQFFYVPNSFTATPGVPMNTNLVAPGIPAGTTVRTDSASLSWQPQVNPPVFGAKNQLSFGATLDVQTASVGTKSVYPSKASFSSATWILNDNTKVNTAALAAHTIQMGQDVFDVAGNPLVGLVFTYTNDDATSDVTLSDLVFFTTSDDNALAEADPAGTFLTNALVTLNGTPLPTQSTYDVPSLGTLQFTFPDTSDPFFVAEADVSADGVSQLGYGYEAQLRVDEPSSWIALATALGLLCWNMRTSARMSLVRR